jgi:uncharacterized protein (DUF2344 family)
LILDAYKIAEDKIKWFIGNVLDGKNDSEGINAAMTMMLNHGLNKAYAQMKMKEKREEDHKQRIEKKKDEVLQEEVIDSTYKKKDKKLPRDISAFL